MKKQKNVLLSYRVQRFDAEIVNKIIKYKNDKIYLVVQNKFEKNFIDSLIKLTDKLKNLNLNINIITAENFLKGELDHMLKKFDYIAANPPYQIPTGPNKTQTIYDELTVRFYNMLKDNGKMAIIHPGSWRFTSDGSKKALKELRKIYAENNIISMELNDLQKGQETFNASTDYDVITMIKEPNKDKTKIITKNDGIINKDLNDFDLIPTDNFEIFEKLKAKDTEEKVELLYDSTYHTQRTSLMSKEKNKINKYPCIYSLPNNEISIWYSNEDRGHFNIPKIIIKKAATWTLLDINGEYGLTQFAGAIVDTTENLVKIQKVIDNNYFQNILMSMVGQSEKRLVDPKGKTIKFIKEFRKDFWKDFYTDEMEQELIKEGKLNSDGSFNTNYKGD